MVFEGLPYRYAIMHVCMCGVFMCGCLCVVVCVFLHQVFAVNRDKDQSKGACWMKRALCPN